MFFFNKYKTDISETLKMAYPISLGQFGIMLMSIVDSAMVGRLGAAWLAAASIANSLFILILIFGLGVCYAVTPLVAIAIGEKNTDGCGNLLRQSFYVNFIVGIFLLVLCYFFADLIYYFNLPPEITSKAISYLKILGYSMLPIMIYQTFKQFIEGFGIMKPGMYVSLTANIVNFVTNWLLIYGNFGFPRLDLDGAGYATLFSRVFMIFGILLFFYMDNRFTSFRISFLPLNIDRRVFAKLLRLGIPVGLQHFFEVGAFSLAALMAGWIGVNELASHHIAMNIASVTFMLILGISAAVSVRVGNAYGERNVRKIKVAGFTGLALSFSFMLFFGVTLIILNKFLPYLYVNDPKVVEIASGLLIIAALFQIFDGLQATGIGILRGLTDMKIPMVISFASYWLIGILSGYFLAFHFSLGIYGIWIGFLLSLIASSSLFHLRFRAKLQQLENQFKPFI
ncbi:MAG: MATE family efflux transporter [Ignavibacteriaceae bacterium]